MRKYVFAIILALCLAAVLLPGTPAAADGHPAGHTCLCGEHDCNLTGRGHEKITDDVRWEGIGNSDFKDAIKNNNGKIGAAGETHYYYLTGDINCDSGAHGVYFCGKIVLCLNGHTIDISGNRQSLVIYEDANAELTICDCNRDKHTIQVKDTSYSYEYYGGTIKDAIEINIGVFNMYNCAIIECNAEDAVNVSSTATFNMYDGANILGNVNESQNAVDVFGAFNMFGGRIAGNYRYSNSSTSGGGGVKLGFGAGTITSPGTFNMYGGTIEDNRADNGGGVYVTYGSTFNMYGGEIKNNRTHGGGWQNHGGGILIDDGTFNMYGGSITGNETGTGNGGGIALRNNNTGTVNIYGGTISGNTSHGYGGGIYAGNNSITIKPEKGDVVISGNTAEQCPTEGHQTGIGGGIFTNSSLTILKSSYTTTISGNTAQHFGGGVAMSGTFIMEDGTISGNKSEQGGSGVFVSNGNFKLQGGSITGNTTRSSNCCGAAVYVNGGEMDMSAGASISENGKGRFYIDGGGVYIANGTFNLNGGSISGSRTVTNGGGVYVSGGTFNLNSGSITGNWATNGSGVYVSGGTFNFNGGSVDGNTASYGGGLYCTGGTVTIKEGSTISGNQANYEGGGVYVGAVNANDITMTGGSITGNSAGSHGGGVYVVNEGTFKVSGSPNVSGNTVNGKANNVDLTHGNGNVLTITGALSGAKFGITANVNVPFTSGWTSFGGNDPTAYFAVDADDKYIALSNGELELRSIYKVFYVTNGGEFVSGYTPPGSYTQDSSDIPLPGADNITKVGHTFDGWYENADFSGNACTVIPSGSTGTKTYYAKWMANTYSVTLVTNGGTINSGNVTEYTYGVGATLPTSIEKRGHTFAGWYDNAQFTGNAVTEISGTEYGNKSYYARWTTNTYSVTLHLNDGVLADGVSNITAYTYGDKIVLPDSNEIIRSGYVFGGWYADKDFKDGPYTEISSTDVGDKDFYARWMNYNVLDTHDIIVDRDIPGGMIDTSLSNASKGAMITVTAVPETGWRLAYITLDGERIDKDSFIMPDHDVYVSAVFTDGLPFTDVKTDDWFYNYVAYAYVNGIMEGVEADKFAPNSPLTRAMVWAVLARIDGVEVSGDSWMTVAQKWAVESGVSDGTNPTGYITREQLVTMLWRYNGSPTVEYTITAPDAASISDWALDAMKWAASTGLIEGDDLGNLNPTSNSTRAHAATFFMRYLEK